mmetsp:Transcript_82948/g.158369  ORF Transcript_82948/g.158369 Transcript_82948/m.158369 type:complete len:303 (+) Transcript_82948:48-956(+)
MSPESMRRWQVLICIACIVARASTRSVGGLPGCKNVSSCATSFGCDTYNPGIGNPRNGYPYCGDMVIWDLCKLASDGTCSAASSNACDSKTCYKDTDGGQICAGGRFACEVTSTDIKLTPTICPCLDVIPAPGGRGYVNARFCNGSAATQQWERVGSTFRSKAVNGSCLTKGFGADVAPCDGSASQNWELDADGLLKSSGKLLRYHTDLATAYCEAGTCPSANPPYDKNGFVYPDGWHLSTEDLSFDMFPSRFWVFRDGYLMSQVLSSLMGSMQCSPKHWPPLPLAANIHQRPGEANQNVLV